ncbi:MAG TPA: zf-HC2 domain-containing protein [Pyrinomonadaceae bacterium]|nr:zf-HC2 domain-containing protein [Pyrinomonadaceae bacterium]
MSPAELLAADEHLAACESCRRSLAEGADPGASFAALLDSYADAPGARATHLTYEQLAAYVDHESGDPERAAIESHMAACARCHEEARDLFAFKESLAASPVHATESEREPARASWSLAALWRRIWHTNALRLAGAAAVLLLAVGLTLWLFLKPAGTGSNEVVEVKPTPTPAASPGETHATPTPSPEVRQEVQASDRRPETTPTQIGPRPAPAAEPAATVIALNDGPNRVAVDGRGRVEGLDFLSPEDRRAVRSALLNRRVAPPAALAGLEARQGTLMSVPGSADTPPGATIFGPESPVGKVLRSDAPTFRWQPLAGASSYTVNVFDTDFRKVATAAALGSTEWTPPRALGRGRLYSWQVTAVKDGQEITSPAPPAPEAKFRILDDSQNRKLERAEQQHADSHLTLGVLYAQAGLLDEAEREFQALVEANPSSVPARELLKSVRALKQPR